MFTKKEFQTCIFYPAAGTDIQIMLRLSHLSNIIIAPNVSEWLTPDRTAELFEKKCKYINSCFDKKLIELVNVVEEKDRVEGLDKYSRDPGVFSSEEKRQYSTAFSEYMSKDLKLYRYTFNRYVGSTVREIRWYSPSAEGLATLTELFSMHGVPPRILVTIQSGILERPDSLLVRIMKKMEIFPEVWVRGYWPCMAKDRVAITNFPPYKIPIQNFGHYNSLLSADGVENEDCICDPPLSYVRAFSRSQEDDEAEIESQKSDVSNRIVHFYTDSILDHVSDYDICFVTRKIRNQLPKEFSCEIVTLEEVSGQQDYTLPPFTLLSGLDYIEKYCKGKERLNSVAMVPVGFEDEITELDSFLYSGEGPIDISIYSDMPFDFSGVMKGNRTNS